MKSMFKVLSFCVVLGPLFGGGTLGAAEVVKTFDFVVDAWHEIEETDGPVALHRIRIDRKEGRLTKSTLARPYNQSYLEPVRFQLEYSNGSTEKWRARVTVRWRDEEGRIIDGFSANEVMGKKSAHKVAQASVATLKYGLERAKTLEVEVRFEP